MKWTLAKLKAKAEKEGISMAELGRRGGRKAARLRRKLSTTQLSSPHQLELW